MKQFQHTSTTPPESPLAMPRHELYEGEIPLRTQRSVAYMLKTLFCRLWVLIVSAALAYYGISEMYAVLKNNTITSLQWVFLILFSINFIWIAYAFSQACLGFIASLIPKISKPKEAEPDFTTAVLMPVYNEDPNRIHAAIVTMRQQLIEKAPHKYAFFILSDTNRADAWLHEECVFKDLISESQDSACPVYYRRRSNNIERKAGNIADWVQRWGNAFKAMVILDADSLMSADCLITLSRRLAANKKIGLIQSLPTIVHAQTLYGRLQQFANQCYGPIYAKGLSAWHGYSSNFWGHNAIINTQAFAESCCLPILRGKPPFGGHIMSHDFIEAALLRRAGWAVRFDTDINASYEEAPPSLTDVLIRDRRWCQGNLQHFPFMLVHGFPLPTRLHIFAGIMSYFSAVFWLLLIIVGLAIAVQAILIRPEYFANPSLFPTWPVFDAEKALSLFMLSMALVITPKLFGWFSALINIKRCLQFGGPILLTFSVITELLFSALYAPVMLISQFSVVVSILRGKDSGWAPQVRDDGALSWAAVTRLHAFDTLFGIMLSLISISINLDLFYWLLPISAGLMLSIPLSWISGGKNRMAWIRFLGLLRSPQENRFGKDPLLEQFNRVNKSADIATKPHVLEKLISENELFNWHLAQLDDNQDKGFHAPTVTAKWKIEHAKDISHLRALFEAEEIMAMLGSPECLHLLKLRFANDSFVNNTT